MIEEQKLAAADGTAGTEQSHARRPTRLPTGGGRHGTHAAPLPCRDGHLSEPAQSRRARRRAPRK